MIGIGRALGGDCAGQHGIQAATVPTTLPDWVRSPATTRWDDWSKKKLGKLANRDRNNQ
jgi:hypothetical protein